MGILVLSHPRSTFFCDYPVLVYNHVCVIVFTKTSCILFTFPNLKPNLNCCLHENTCKSLLQLNFLQISRILLCHVIILNFLSRLKLFQFNYSFFNWTRVSRRLLVCCYFAAFTTCCYLAAFTRALAEVYCS
jgi:hypothetical protein